MIRSRICSLLTILIIFESVSNCNGTTVGGWSTVQNISTVQSYVNEICTEIIDLLNDNGYNVNEGCYVHAIFAESQVVAGTNYKVNIRVCKKYADIEFFVPLPVNGQAQSPTDLSLV